MCMKNITFRILIRVLLESIIGDSVVTCSDIGDVIAKSYDKPTNFNEKR